MSSFYGQDGTTAYFSPQRHCFILLYYYKTEVDSEQQEKKRIERKENITKDIMIINIIFTYCVHRYFNQSNRGFPDVSALGHMYLILENAEWYQVDGYEHKEDKTLLLFSLSLPFSFSHSLLQ